MSNIQPFIKKYKSAISSKSSEMRISIEEATAIVTAFAELETNKDNIEKKLDMIYTAISNIQNTDSGSDYMDGGTF